MKKNSKDIEDLANANFIKHYAPNKFKAIIYGFWLKTGAAHRLKLRRLKFISDLTGGWLNSSSADEKPMKILEIGSGSGRDAIIFLKDSPHQIWGIDIYDSGFRQNNFTFIEGDASKIEFPDKFFDVVISLGVLEHIAPIEKLSEIICEIDRVSNSYCIGVPSISTLIEPHKWRPLWQLMAKDSNETLNHLNYFSDEAWLSFSAFMQSEAKCKRFYYLPPFITSLFIYKP